MRSPSFLLVVCLLWLGSSLPLSGELALEIDSDSVTLTGLPPGGTAVLVGTARYGETYRQRHEVFRELLTDEDEDGRATRQGRRLLAREARGKGLRAARGPVPGGGR